MDRPTELRQFFAHMVTANAGIPPGSAIEAAFASTPREQFVAPPPWRVFTPRGYYETISADPAYIYQDTVLALGGDHPGLNNGQPTLHAYCIHTLGLKPGDRVVHIGAGTGYYTTLLAKLVGEAGHVTAFEIEPDLAARAKENLAIFPHAAIESRSGAISPIPACNAIYINAGATEPLSIWLDALEIEGRLLFPLTGPDGNGAMLLITRKEDGVYTARFLMPVAFVPCMGARDKALEKQLSKALRNRDWQNVRFLHRNSEPAANCWLAGNGWWLATQ
ncbi:protein-L-isoaspartate O-methyltransferase [Acidicapsa dinghuensis]|uniref:Protein-L-isoaspartate O-methyltransferase n=1 Tax=Acidicapsa dinghuensis TaxID=2218256 RepID=A0ABW1ELH8_9BACT|nr:rRNA adenine N-6-methyltransferase family protein [Acidicapsa dinghuensis]